MYSKRSGSLRARFAQARRSRGNKVVWKNKLLPDKIHIKMPYHTFNTFTATQATYMLMRGNGPYDPDVVVGGTQPPLYDDMASWYFEYYVVGSKIKVRFINNGPEVAKVYVLPFNGIAGTTFTPTSGAQIDNQQYVKAATLSPSTSGTSNAITFKMYMSTNKIVGKDTTEDPDFSAPTTSTPTNEWGWQIGAYDYSAAGIPLNMHVEVDITYYTEWRKRRAVQLDD